MNTTTDTPDIADRSVLMDFLAFTPSPTLSRELFALVVSVAGLIVLMTILDLSFVAEAVTVGVFTLFMVGRLVAGFLTRGYGTRER